MSQEIQSYPTIGPKGLRFRSRLEAIWATFFDLLKWDWEYEPFDLKGYIPDFILTFDDKDKTQVLVEVKGELNYDNLKNHYEKIQKSGWEGDAIIVGAKLFEKHMMYGVNVMSIGVLCYNHKIDEKFDIGPGPYFDHAYLRYECNTWNIDYDIHDGHWIMTIGKYPYDKYPEYKIEKIQKLWVEAKNNCQWKKDKLEEKMKNIKL